MTSCAWLWIYAGSALMLLELVAPGFILCFFGLSAATVGVLRFAFGESFGPTWQLAAFSVLSVLYIALLRRYLKGVFVGDSSVSGGSAACDNIGRTGRVTEAVGTGVPGRVMLGDAEWSAIADSQIPVGANVKVISQDNLTIKVKEV